MSGREWVQIRGWARPLRQDPNGAIDENERGWIPRDVLEKMGIDCSPLDRRDHEGHQETVWFSREQSDKIRAHKEFEPTP